MHHVTRFILIPLLTATLTGGAWAADAVKEPAKEAPKAAEYKRSDTNFYWKGDVLKANPSAVIIPKGGYTQQDDSYFFTPRIRAPKSLYFEVLNDWIEPITPPDMPASLGVPPDAMQIREPQGDVRVALPSAPTNFVLVTDGMTIPNGAVVKTGADGTAAVLFGGVDSARLIPNSEAAVQQTVTAKSRSVEVDLTAGGVFSKVGTQEGVKGEYDVRTPCGVAVVHGGDFVTLATSNRTDVWVAQGNVQFVPVPGGKSDFVATSDGTGALKLIRFPQITDPHQAMLADAETLTTVLNFIPMADQKIKSLRDKLARGTPLTANEQDYLNRIKQVPCLIKLALVEPPAPTPAPTPAVPAVAVPPTPPSPANLGPLNIVVHPNGTIRFQGATMGLAEFQAKLLATVKATPDATFVIKAGPKVPYEKIKAVLDSCADSQVKHVSIATPPPQPSPPTAATPPPAAPVPVEPAPVPAPAISSAPTTAAPASEMPVPGPIIPVQINLRADGGVDVNGAPMALDDLKSRLADIAKANPNQPLVITGRENVTPDQLNKVIAICHAAKLKVKVAKAASVAPTPIPQTTATNPAPASPAAPAPAPTDVVAPTTAPAPLKPIRAVVRIDGKINFQGATYELPEFKTKLETLMKTTPDQAIVIKAGKTVPYEKFAAALDTCKTADVKNLTVATPAPVPPPPAPPTPPESAVPAAAEPATNNPPIPGLLMHPSMEPMSSNTSPMAPPESPAQPTTNAPPPSGP